MKGPLLAVFALVVSQYVFADKQQDLRNGQHDKVIQEDVLDAFKAGQQQLRENLETQPSNSRSSRTTVPKDYSTNCFSCR